MKKRLFVVLISVLAMVMAATPALALSASDMEGIPVPKAPAEAPAGLEIKTVTEGEMLSMGPWCCPCIQTGPCLEMSLDAPMDMMNNNDELMCAYALPVYVDIVHSLAVGVFDDAGYPKCSFYLGNMSPVLGYKDPDGRDGSDSGTFVVASNDEYVRAVWASEALEPICWDDAAGPAWNENGDGEAADLPLKVQVDGGAICVNAVPPNCVTQSAITVSVDKPDWQNEAGMYAGYVVVAAWQL